ncbi:S-adenosyl-L-methionine-dependent methyltransferase [Bombardia bombarda]|uniref:S-adenosyl-L-methionine-dependent methyltransferase n=1 Tax=Bombardia bombarda TaxID=252184 RepID=A0AA40CA84_9PEZI|nr:S-adenosyl-L-methionine-dependent methyltransferase [Bombardia bombarda]
MQYVRMLQPRVILTFRLIQFPIYGIQEDEQSENDADLGGESDTSSLRSSILSYRRENGRTYHAYKDGSYVLPNDEMENQRLDLQHHLFSLTFDEVLNLAPLQKEPARVLDAGCGTGIWAIDFADEHPESQIIGVDLSPIQPPFAPPNVSFFVDDLEDVWTFSEKFDYVFARFLTGSILDWPKFFAQSYESLSPGGIIELQDIIYPMQCDDGSLDKNSAIYRWSELLLQSFTAIGRPLNSALKYKEQLAEAGFVDIVEVQYKWPSNRWPKDPKYKKVGIWTYENAIGALSALSLAVFTRPKGEGGQGWTVDELEVLLDQVRKDFRNLNIHAYWPISVVYAKKPE